MSGLNNPIWGALDKIFREMIKGYDSADLQQKEEIKKNAIDKFRRLKGKWCMSEELYEVYIEECLKAKRLLTEEEFIKLTPELGSYYPELENDIADFLVKVLQGCQSNQSNQSN